MRSLAPLRIREAALLLALSFGILVPAAANAQWTGAGVLSGSERLAISGCGKSRSSFGGQYALANSGSLMLPGDYATQVGNVWSSGLAYPQLILFEDFKRVWDLSAPAWADPASLSTKASSLCGEAVTVTAFQVVSHTLKLNKRGTRAKVALEAAGTALRAGGSSTLAYGVKAAGPW